MGRGRSGTRKCVYQNGPTVNYVFPHGPFGLGRGGGGLKEGGLPPSSHGVRHGVTSVCVPFPQELCETSF